jgi:uncharacterized PurR-regulated membrane protein YhhQ (DUF165 family)
MLREKFALTSPLIVLSTAYTLLMLLCYFFSNKELLYPFGLMSTPGMMMLPAAIITMDIIAEIFGYRQAQKTLWLSLILQFAFCMIGYFLTILPDNDSIPGGVQAVHYQQIFGI